MRRRELESNQLKSAVWAEQAHQNFPVIANVRSRGPVEEKPYSSVFRGGEAHPEFLTRSAIAGR